MNSELNVKTDMNVTKTGLAEASFSLKDIIVEYKAIAVKLSLFADTVPETQIQQQEFSEKEVQLLDKQAELLETALSRPVRNLDDAKAVLTLWHHEIVQSQSSDSLSAADELVNSVFNFLKDA